jgi:hypothetical protein
MKYQQVVMAKILIATILCPAQIFAISAWPDTGQDKCYNNYVQIPCPQPGQAFYGQDAQHQGIQPSYTKLDTNGNELPNTASAWTMVRDNVTGLIWEVKTDDEGIHDVDNEYYWCDSQEIYPGGCTNPPNTELFIKQLNLFSFGNQSDWRLPTIEELSTLFNLTSLQGIDTIYFPPIGNPNIYHTYWSSTTQVDDTTKVWCISYDKARIELGFKNSSFNGVIAVRGETSLSVNRFVNNHDGTTTDSLTGLVWQQNTAIIDGGSTPDLITWKDGLNYIQNQNYQKFAGYADWRLPNINELISLLDFSQIGRLLHQSLVPATNDLLNYWSSTTTPYNDDAFGVYFRNGSIASYNKTTGRYVRMVRGGNKLLFNLKVSIDGNGTGSVNSSPAGISCGSDCSEMYNPNTVVTLTATPSAKSIFSGWSGDCSGNGPCVVRLNFHKTVSANFVEPVMSPILYLLRSSSGDQ